MASCEKCWADATMISWDNPMMSVVECYHDLLEERKDNPCTPEEQAGEDATTCPECERETIHQYARHCVVCGYKK